MKKLKKLSPHWSWLLTFAFWTPASFFVLTLAVLLLAAPQLFFWLPPFLQQKLDYRLYSALPQREGSVLSSSIISADQRRLILQRFLRAQNSPMAPYAADFIEAADKYDLPWTLLPAIAGKESGFGKVIPKNSYNAFGWAVYTGQQRGAVFSSWRDAIFTVAKGLRENYFNRGLDTLEEIEPIYTPPSAKKGHPWLLDVRFFMEQIANWPY